jgi:hypothetical protein
MRVDWRRLFVGHAFDTRNSTASQRFAASLSTRCYRSPAATLWVEIEENLVFPTVTRQPVAQGDGLGLFALGWLKKMRDTITAPKELSPRASVKDPGSGCRDAARQTSGPCFQSFQKFLNRSGAISVYRTVCMIFLWPM